MFGCQAPRKLPVVVLACASCKSCGGVELPRRKFLTQPGPKLSISELGRRCLAEISSRAGEYDGDGARIPDHLAGRREQPGAGIHPKRHDRVALLVGRMEKPPCRVEADESRVATVLSSSLSTQTTGSFG